MKQTEFSIPLTLLQTMVHLLITLAIVALHHSSTHITAAAPASTEPPPSPLSPAAQDFLQAHNQARSDVGVPPLKWSPNLANASSLLVRYQRNKMGCKFADLNGSKYGGNQLYGRGSPVTPLMAVETWVKEKEYYFHGNNSCAENHQCGVYTQVVWRNSSELGCAQGVCGKEQASLTICFYFPPGNYVGESPY